MMMKELMLSKSQHDKTKEAAQKTRKMMQPSPNYMKGTKSSEAKKEQRVPGLSKLQRVPRTLTRMHSLKGVKTLPRRRKKHAGSGTCSSTQKEVKFPSELKLDPGATQAQGGSVVKVCSYNHCSLNRHESTPVPRLKSFLASKRRLLKTQKVLPFAPGQDKGSNFAFNDANELSGGSFDMELKEGKMIFVTNVDDDLKVFTGEKTSAYQHDEISELEWQNFSDVDSVSDCNKLPEVKSSDEQGGSCPDIADVPTKDRGLLNQKEAGNDTGQKENMHQLLSNRDKPDHKYFQTDEETSEESKVIEEDNTSSSLENGTIVCCEHREVASIVLKESFLSDPNEEISETRDEVIGFCKYPNEVDANESNEEYDSIKGALQKTGITETFSSTVETPETVNTKFMIEVSNSSKEQTKNSFVEVKVSGMDGISTRVEVDVFSIIRNHVGSTKHNRSKFKRSKRHNNKSDKDRSRAKEFKPRGPNFLPLAPELETERVVLRHQEIDKRRSAEEWMLDYALRKAVNRLASVRRRNVALLVQAFEAVVGGK